MFELLNEELQKIVKKRFKEPTLPQKLGIPPILSGENVLLIAQTGTGKTESGMLPIFNLWMDKKPKPISILYITPLRALNRDMLYRLNWWAEEIGMDISVRHGDTTQYVRKMQAEVPPDCLITTPETLQAILPAKKMGEHLKNVEFIVVDEVHEIFDSKRGIQLSMALERLKEKTEKEPQIIGLSATVGSPEKIANFLSGGKPIRIVKATTSKELSIKVITPKTKKQDADTAKKIVAGVETSARVRTISDMIKAHASTLIFTNTRDFAEILSSRLKVLDPKLPIETHHSSLSKEVRIRAEKRFKRENLKALIATSSLELGIDIGSIDYIIQYMSPRQTARILQRIGRSGHEINRLSEGVIISTDDDDVFEAAVIARRALNEELEPLRFHEKALDVLAHQIVGLTMDNYKIDVNRAYEIVKKAYPYRDLTKEEFLEVCEQLREIGLVWLNGYIKKRKNGLLYYFTNLSTIPDTKNYKIINTLTNEPVGSLDEEFVALHGDQNTTFIVKGEPWRILSVEGRRIFVEPSSDIEAAIPGWESELIPVPYEVAQEVGSLREFVKNELNNKTSVRSLILKLQKKYPIDDNSARKIIHIIKKQMKFGIVPTHKLILIEDHEDFVILHTCFGSKVNETLGRFLTALLSSRLGTVGLRIDPYRIIMKFGKKDVELVKKLLLETDPELLKEYVRMSLSHSDLFEWKFIHVAKRFGAIRKDAEFSKFRIKRIIESYAGSPIFKETLREIEIDKLDMNTSIQILKMVQKGEIKITYKNGLSPLGRIGLTHQRAELIGQDKPLVEVFELFKRRLMRTSIKLICVNCGRWSQTFLIEELPDDVMCRKCGARLLGIIRPNDIKTERIVRKKLEKKPLSNYEMRRFEKVRRTADLFIVYRKRAAKALAVRGVGPETAARVLARMYSKEDDFLRYLLEAQRQWIRTKRFWKARG